MQTIVQNDAIVQRHLNCAARHREPERCGVPTLILNLNSSNLNLCFYHQEKCGDVFHTTCKQLIEIHYS